MGLISRSILWSLGQGYGSATIASEVRAVRRFVRGGIFMDVGANKGLYSRELLKAYGDALRQLHCFEPSAGLVSNHLGFADSRVVVNQCALGREQTEGQLWKAPGLPGLSSLTKRRLDHFDMAMNESESIRITTLDAYAESAPLDHIDFLKLDVEGHELDVLAGAQRLLGAAKIKCIQFEFGGCNIDTRTFFQDFWYLLAVRHGYAMFRISPFGLRCIKKYSETDEIFLTTNYLAVKE